MTETKKRTEFGKILYTSQSGKGKTYSFRNMNENTTGFVNAELKPLPFRKNFKYHGKPKNIAGAIKCLQDYSFNPEVDCIVIDSLTAIFEMFEKELSKTYTGYDLWAAYNKKITELLDIIKLAEKEVFVTSHYEVLNIEKNPEKRVKVLGKRWEGTIEKEFTIVLYADCKFNNEKPEYFFKLSGEGLSAKCPPDLFGEGVNVVANDSAEILKKVKEYYSS
jgi:hypothetical protein